MDGAMNWTSRLIAISFVIFVTCDASVAVSASVSGGVGCDERSGGLCFDGKCACQFTMEINGEITATTADEVQKLFAERRKYGPKIVGERLEVDSRGGSVSAAITIGRMFRNENASLLVEDNSVCISACVLILAGAVDRLIASSARVGIHRPYLGTTPQQQFAPEQIKSFYANMLQAMRAYLKEMNVSERLADDMLKTEPEAVHFLSEEELSAYGLAGIDPGEQQRRAIEKEAQDVQEAKGLGLDRLEYIRRKALGDRICEYTSGSYMDYVKCKQTVLRTGRR
jgi:ATP-dependent protease ClpP protease subunit